MREYKIYTAGKMGGLSFEEQMEWRCKLEIVLNNSLSYKGKSVKFIHPPEYYQPVDDASILYEKEAMEWDLRQLKSSDVVVVNLKGIDTSVGTIQEVAVAKETGKMIVAIGSPDDVHPWIRCSVSHFSPSVEYAAEYITDYIMI